VWVKLKTLPYHLGGVIGGGFYAVRFLCCEVKQISKVKVKCFVRVLNKQARQGC